MDCCQGRCFVPFRVFFTSLYDTDRQAFLSKGFKCFQRMSTTRPRFKVYEKVHETNHKKNSSRGDLIEQYYEVWNFDFEIFKK